MNLREVIIKLSNLRGMSGFEYRIAPCVAEMFADIGCSAEIDAMGSVIAVLKCGKSGANCSVKRNNFRIMLDAHIDEIGLMVAGIDSRGFLRFINIGGVDERILPGCEVTVHGSDGDIYGVIGIKPPHIQSADENKKVVPIDELVIDIGMDAEAAKNAVNVGDAVTFAQEAFCLQGGQLCGKSMDDRAGIAALLYAAEVLAKRERDADIYFVCSVQEETHMTGAKTAAYAIDPHAALVIDVTHGITADNSDRAYACGGGAVMSVGPNVHPALNRLIGGIAEELGGDDKTIEIEVDGGSTGTNAWAVQVAQIGVPTAVLSIPLRYMHSPTEVLDIADVAKVGDIAAEFAARAALSLEEVCL